MRITTRQFAPIVILVISLLLSPITLMAQTATSDWSRLASMPAGNKLSVKLRNGKKIDGILSSVSDTAVTLLRKNTTTEVKRDDIKTVHQLGGASVTKSTLIGLGVGTGAGAIVGVAVRDNDSFLDLDNVATAAITVIGAGVGALTGYAIGATRKKRVLIYEAK